MKVYVITEGPRESGFVMAIFSTRKKADEFVKIYESNIAPGSGLFIYEYPVDPTPEDLPILNAEAIWTLGGVNVQGEVTTPPDQTFAIAIKRLEEVGMIEEAKQVERTNKKFIELMRQGDALHGKIGAASSKLGFKVASDLDNCLQEFREFSKVFDEEYKRRKKERGDGG